MNEVMFCVVVSVSCKFRLYVCMCVCPRARERARARACVCMCVCVCVCDVLTALSVCVFERSYIVLSSNCCMYMCLLRSSHVLRQVFDSRWLLHWPG